MDEQINNETDEQQERQDAASGLDSTVREILAEESQDASETKDVQSKDQGAEVEKDEQPTYEITEETFEELKSLGYEETDLDSFEPDDIKNILETKTEKPKSAEPEKKEQPQTILVTEDMAKPYGGFAKNFIGKPIDELFKAIKKNDEFIQKQNADLRKLKSETTKNIEKQADEILAKIKDPNSNLSEDEVYTLIEEYGKIQRQVERERMALEVSDSDKEAEGYNQLQGYLNSKFPDKTVDARESFDKWARALSPEDKELFGKASPQAIANAISNYIELENKNAEIERLKNESVNKEKDKESETRKLAAEKARKAINGAKDKAVGSKYKIVSRAAPKKYQGADKKTMMEILEEAEED